MPEHLRSLIVVLILATMVFAFVHRPAIAIIGAENFTRRRNLWIALTLAAFLSQNFWIYVAIASLLLLYTNRHESNPVALYFFTLFVLPVAYVQIPGMGIVNYLFELSHASLLGLVILLSVLFKLRKQVNEISFGRFWPDKILTIFILLSFALGLRYEILSEGLRFGVTLFLKVYLPYFVISRSLKTMQHFRDALMSLVIAILLVAITAIFEANKQWLLYSAVTEVLQLSGGMTEYLVRDGLLRAIATTGQPIALGYLMVIGIGIYLFLQRSIEQKFLRWGGMILLIGGLIAPLSRGPWVGAGVLIFVYFLSGRNPFRRLMGMALAAIFALFLASVLPGGERVINLLPFIGSTEKQNADYREQLFSNSMIVIQRNLLFGSSDYRETPELEAMRQGQGIIDIVNTYLQVTLDTGIVGLSLFLAFFMFVLLGISRAMRSIQDKNSEAYLLGQALLSTQIAILVIIFSVSSITIIPMMYWCMAAVGVAYSEMVQKNGSM